MYGTFAGEGQWVEYGSMETTGGMPRHLYTSCNPSLDRRTPAWAQRRGPVRRTSSLVSVPPHCTIAGERRRAVAPTPVLLAMATEV